MRSGWGCGESRGALHRPFAFAQGKQDCPPRRAGLCHERILQGGEGEAMSLNL